MYECTSTRLYNLQIKQASFLSISRCSVYRSVAKDLKMSLEVLQISAFCFRFFIVNIHLKTFIYQVEANKYDNKYDDI